MCGIRTPPNVEISFGKPSSWHIRVNGIQHLANCFRYSDPHFNFLVTSTVHTDSHESKEIKDKIGLHVVGVKVTNRDISIRDTVGIARLTSLSSAGTKVRG